MNDTLYAKYGYIDGASVVEVIVGAHGLGVSPVYPLHMKPYGHLIWGEGECLWDSSRWDRRSLFIPGAEKPVGEALPHRPATVYYLCTVELREACKTVAYDQWRAEMWRRHEKLEQQKERLRSLLDASVNWLSESQTPPTLR